MRNYNAQGGHGVRDFILGAFVIFLVLVFAPQLEGPPAPHSADQATNDALAQVDQPPSQTMTWKVMHHDGYNPAFDCWMLRLNITRSATEQTTSQFCAQDKADYDSHADGSDYQTNGGWLSNVMQHAPGSSNHT